MYIIDHSFISSSSDTKSYFKYYLIYLTVPVTLMLKVWIVQKKGKGTDILLGKRNAKKKLKLDVREEGNVKIYMTKDAFHQLQWNIRKP